MAKQSYIEFIRDLCPQRVEWKNLGAVTTIIRGKRVTKSQLIENGKYPVISGGIEPMGYINDYNRDENTITIAQYGTAGYVNFIREKFWANDVCYSVYPTDEILNKYLYYCLIHNQDYFYRVRNTDAIPYSIALTKIQALKIPVPPLAVQKKIIQDLDTFANLIENIDNEIIARQKQFVIALNRFFEADIKRVEISQLGKITRGRRFVRTDIVDQGTPCIHYGDIYTRYPVCVNEALTFLTGDITKKMRYAQSGDVVYVGAGENNEDIGMAIAWLSKEPAAVHDACYILSEHKQDAKYLAYMSRANDFHQQLKMSVASGKICSIPPDGLGRVKIPVPPIAEQRAIAEKLDTIEAFINNLKTERALRQQQYEYYREHLINLLK